VDLEFLGEIALEVPVADACAQAPEPGRHEITPRQWDVPA
jgi:hypothetical protein